MSAVWLQESTVFFFSWTVQWNLHVCMVHSGFRDIRLSGTVFSEDFTKWILKFCHQESGDDISIDFRSLSTPLRECSHQDAHTPVVLFCCVCVDHLHRCKTSLFGWWLFFVFYPFCIIIAGGHRRPIELCPTKLSMVSLGYPGWSPGRTCTRFETFDCHGTWLTQEPPRRFSVASGPSSELQCQQVSIHCTVFAIWIIADFVRWNSCFLQGQRKNSSLWGFSLPCPPTFACQILGDCLCTPDALHISNSIRYFWASVSLIPLSDKVVWALRGKPF